MFIYGLLTSLSQAYYVYICIITFSFIGLLCLYMYYYLLFYRLTMSIYGLLTSLLQAYYVHIWIINFSFTGLLCLYMDY